jgi:tetratricopeptide (TPR) repeat protein
MMRVTSLTNLSDRQLDRLIKRVALLAVVVLIGFVAFYVFDRYRLPQAPIVDREVASLESAVQANPRDIASRGRLADLYVAKGRYQDAIDQYDQILSTNEDTVQAHFGRGEALRLSGQLDAAAKDYQAVVDALKDTDEGTSSTVLEGAYLGLGRIALAESRPGDAVQPLEAALAISSADADVLDLLGAAYVKTGDTTKAIAALKKAIAFVPYGWADPYVTLADAYAKAGDTAHAGWANAMADLSDGNGTAAETQLKELASGPAALDAAIGLGVLYETRGDTASASQWYSKALAIDPNDQAAKLGLTRVSPLASADFHAGVSPAPATPAPAASLPAPGQLQEGQP